MNKKALISILLTIILVWFLLAQIHVREIVTTLNELPLHLVLLGFVFYALSYLFRALRFRLFLQKDIGLGVLFNLVAVHTMWTNILPFRSGELSYLYLLKQKGGAESYLTGVPSLFLARFFDLFSVSILFVFSFIGIGSLPRELINVSIAILFLVFGLSFFCISLLWKREVFLGKLKSYIIRFRLEKVKVIERLIGKGGEVLKGFESMKSVKAIFIAASYSLIMWVFMYMCNLSLIKAVGIDLNVWQIIFISTFFVLISFLPIHGWAGYGTTEAMWVLVIIWFGITKEKGIVTGFQLHTMALLFTLILGIVAFSINSFRRANR